MSSPQTRTSSSPAPHLREGRRATWFELFFDLAFVAAVAQLTANLASHYEAASFVRYAFLLLLLWWAWLGHTFHATRFDEDRPDQHLLGMCSIGVTVLIAYGAHDALGNTGVHFAVGMAAFKLLLALGYVRERKRPDTMPLIRH